jgi:hypothetical protein
MRRGIRKANSIAVTSSRIRSLVMTSISLAATACGGAPFQLGVVYDGGVVGDDVVTADVVSDSIVVDAGRDVKLALRHDSGAEANVFIEADVDASIDSSFIDVIDIDVIDAKKEAEADVAIEAAPVCTPVTPVATICGSNQAVVSAPQSYCWLTGLGGTSTSGEARAMPQGCRCQETYDCGCLLAAGISCGAAMALHCGLSNGIVVVSCT